MYPMVFIENNGSQLIHFFYLICSLPQPSQSFSPYTFPSSLIDLDQAPLSPHLPATSHLLMMEADPASCLMLGSHEFHCKINGLT